MGVLGVFGREGRRWLWERQETDGTGGGDEDDERGGGPRSDGGGPGSGEGPGGKGPGGKGPGGKGPGGPGGGPGNPAATGTPSGPGGPGMGGGPKGPGGSPNRPGGPGPPGQRLATSTSTTSTTTQETTTSTSSTSTSTTSIEPPTTTSTTPPPPPPKTSTTSTSSSIVTSSTQLPPSFTAIPVVIAPPTAAPIISLPSPSSTTLSTISLAATIIPFPTISQPQTTERPTPAPVVFTPPPVSSATRSSSKGPVQSNGNAFLPNIARTSTSRPTGVSSASSSPSAVFAGNGISSSKSTRPTVIGIGVSIGVVSLILSGLLFFVLRRRRKQKANSMMGRSAATNHSFWDRLSGPLSRAVPAQPPKIPVQDFNTYTPASVPPVQRRFDTSSGESSNVELSQSALFIPQLTRNEFTISPPIYTDQSYQQQGQQSTLRIAPELNPQSYGTTTAIRNGPLSLSWFLGKPSKIPQPVHGNTTFRQPTGYGTEKNDASRNIAHVEAEVLEQEKRWKDSRELADRTSANTNTHTSASSFPQTGNRQTAQSDGWESGIGDAMSARFLSGFGSDTTGHESIAIENARTEFVQSVTREEMRSMEQQKARIARTRREKWESSPDSLNNLPRWRDPMLSIFEEVKENSEMEQTTNVRR
ncbi:hypothetical protein WAI453_007844 [Rhynchosporium graminicola]